MMTETATPSEAIRPLNFLVDVSTALTLKTSSKGWLAPRPVPLEPVNFTLDLPSGFLRRDTSGHEPIDIGM
jgi:hypothetical protein